MRWCGCRHYALHGTLQCQWLTCLPCLWRRLLPNLAACLTELNGTNAALGAAELQRITQFGPAHEPLLAELWTLLIDDPMPGRVTAEWKRIGRRGRAPSVASPLASPAVVGCHWCCHTQASRGLTLSQTSGSFVVIRKRDGVHLSWLTECFAVVGTRGNGMLGLHNLVYFARTFNAVCRSIVGNYDSPAALPLAITSINMTTWVALRVLAWCAACLSTHDQTRAAHACRFVMDLVQSRVLDTYVARRVECACMGHVWCLLTRSHLASTSRCDAQLLQLARRGGRPRVRVGHVQPGVRCVLCDARPLQLYGDVLMPGTTPLWHLVRVCAQDWCLCCSRRSFEPATRATSWTSRVSTATSAPRYKRSWSKHGASRSL